MTTTADRVRVFRQPEASRSTATAAAETPDLMGTLRGAPLRVPAWEIVSTDVLAWASVLDEEDRREFLRDLSAALAASPEQLMLTLHEWADTVQALSVPLRRAILLGGITEEDYVEVERPE